MGVLSEGIRNVCKLPSERQQRESDVAACCVTLWQGRAVICVVVVVVAFAAVTFLRICCEARTGFCREQSGPNFPLQNTLHVGRYSLWVVLLTACTKRPLEEVFLLFTPQKRGSL